MDSYKSKSVLFKIIILGLIVTMLCKSTLGLSEAELKTSIKNDVRSEFQAELRKLRDENSRLSSDDKDELINQQQLQIQALKQELSKLNFRITALEEENYNPTNLLEETNCTAVKECVAEELDVINFKLINDEMRINQIVEGDLVELHDEIDTVVIGFTANDTQLQNTIDNEIKERKQNDGKLQTNIDLLQTNVDSIQATMDKEIEEREQKDDDLQESITAEANARTQEDNVLQSDIDVIYGTPRFIVTATTRGHIPSDVITFDDKIVDISNSFDLTTGKFRVPVAGNYVFQFDSYASAHQYSRVDAYVNGDKVYEFCGSIGDSTHIYFHHDFMFSLKLEEGDELWLINGFPNTLTNDDIHPMTFLGYKTL